MRKVDSQASIFLVVVLLVLVGYGAFMSYQSVMTQLPMPTFNNMCQIKGFCNEVPKEDLLKIRK
jgi:hypothetical protein